MLADKSKIDLFKRQLKYVQGQGADKGYVAKHGNEEFTQL